MDDPKSTSKSTADADGLWCGLLEQIRDVVLLIAVEDGRIVGSNEAAADAYGHDALGADSTRIESLLSTDASCSSSLLRMPGRDSISRAGIMFEDCHMHGGGSTFPVEINARRGELGGQEVIVAVVRDITERKRTDRALAAAYSEIEQIFDTAADGMRIVDRGFNVTRINRTLIEMAGLEDVEPLGMKCFDAFPGTACKTPECTLVRVLRGEGKFADEIVKRRADGTTITCTVTAQPFVVDGEIVGVIEDFHDISERLRAEAEVQHLATHDALTGLPNRLLFTDRLAMVVAQAKRSDVRPALLFCDIDRFKTLNDKLGHATGDEVLVAVSGALQGAVRESDTVARLGGDEFVVLLPSVSAPADAEVVAGKILDAVGRIARFGDATLGVTMSIGVTTYVPGDGEDSLMNRADQAMYDVKEHGGNGCKFVEG